MEHHSPRLIRKLRASAICLFVFGAGCSSKETSSEIREEVSIADSSPSDVITEKVSLPAGNSTPKPQEASPPRAPLRLEALTLRSLGKEPLERLRTGVPGCVGISEHAMLTLLEENGNIYLVLADVSRTHGSTSPQVSKIQLDFLLKFENELENFDRALGGRAFTRCETTQAEPPGKVEILKGSVRIHLGAPLRPAGQNARTHALSAWIESQNEVVFHEGDTHGANLVEVYHSPMQANFFARISTPEQGERANSRNSFAFIEGRALGTRKCLIVAGQERAIAEKEARPFDIANANDGCIAMSADGQMAAFRVSSRDTTDDKWVERPHIAWFGRGIPPKLDLSCVLGTCSAPEQARIAADAVTLGLTACGSSRETLVFDQQALRATMGRHHLEVGGLRLLEITPEDGEGQVGFADLWQRPDSNVAFVRVMHNEGRFEGTSVKTVDLDRVERCQSPKNRLLTGKIESSSNGKPEPRLPQFAEQLVDQDTATAWVSHRGDVKPSLQFALAVTSTVEALELVNGFDRRDGLGDRFPQFGRASRVRLSFSDGTSEDLTLDPDARGPVRIAITPRKTTFVKLEIIASKPGENPDHGVAISEVWLIGRSEP